MIVPSSSAKHTLNVGGGWPESHQVQGHQVPHGGPSETAPGPIPVDRTEEERWRYITRIAKAVSKPRRGPLGLSPPSYLTADAQRVSGKRPRERPIYYLEVARGGSVFRIRRVGGARGSISKRGRIKGFTNSSRRRLLERVHELDAEDLEPGLFVTLTYPGEWPHDPEVWKRDLAAFLKRLTREYPDAVALWKLEPQQRGAPHFHLLVYGADWIPKTWLSRVWYEIVGSGDEQHLKAGTQVKRVRTWRGVHHYAAKYVGKVQDLPDGWQYPGRWWGVHNRAQFKLMRDVITISIKGDGVAQRVRRWARRLKYGTKHYSRRTRRMFRGRLCGISVFASNETTARMFEHAVGFS